MPRIKKAKITHISLVPRGANQMGVLYKQDGHLEVNMIVKGFDDDKGELLAVVYSPNNVDSQGDYADEETIRDMAHSFAKDGEGIDLRHDGKVLSKEQAYVAESFIIQKGDERFKGTKTYNGEEVDVTSGWGVLIKIEDLDLRKKYKSGEWQGVSMAGKAEMEKEEDTSIEKSIVSAIKKILPFIGVKTTTQGDQDVAMTEDQIKKAVSDGIAEGVAAVEKSRKDDKTKDSDSRNDPDRPVFKGDWTDDKALAKHEMDLAIWKARQDCGDDISELRKRMADIKKKFEADVQKEDEEQENNGNSDEIQKLTKEKKALEQKIANLSKASSVKDTNSQSDDRASMLGISKEDLEAIDQAEKDVEAYQPSKSK